MAYQYAPCMFIEKTNILIIKKILDIFGITGDISNSIIAFNFPLRNIIAFLP